MSAPIIYHEADMSHLNGPFELDKHISIGNLKKKLGAGEILLASCESKIVGWLRYGLFWDEMPFMSCTALLDAIGDAIHHITNIHKYARKEDAPKKTIFLITTDGMENASSRYKKSAITRLIEERAKKYGWEFIFLAANIDAVSTASSIGINRKKSHGIHANKRRSS